MNNSQSRLKTKRETTKNGTHKRKIVFYIEKNSTPKKTQRKSKTLTQKFYNVFMIKRRQKKIGYAIIETKSDILIKKNELWKWR